MIRSFVLAKPVQPVVKQPSPAVKQPVVPAVFDPPHKPPSPPRQQIQLNDDKPLMPKPKSVSIEQTVQVLKLKSSQSRKVR